MIKAVIFDFDHTLYDRDATYEAFSDVFAGELSRELDPSLSRAELIARLQDCDRRGVYIGGWRSTFDLSVESGIFREPPSYERYMEVIRGKFSASITLFDDTLATLEQLKCMGLRLGILTNGYIRYQRDKLSHTPEIIPFFEHITVSEEIGFQKPSPHAFLHMCERFGIMPHEAMYVGDHPVNDVCGARSIGMIPVWMRYIEQFPKHITPPPYMIDRLSELPKILNDLNKKEA